MKITETAMTSQSQRLKPSSIPSPTVSRAMSEKAPRAPQFRTRESDLATLPPLVDPAFRGVSDGIRTRDRLDHNQELYLAELRPPRMGRKRPANGI